MNYGVTYQFDVKLSEMYGVNESILLTNFIYWTLKNQANKVNFHDGLTWTYNSVKALTLIFPFWTEKQIRYILDKLEEKQVIKKGNYNKSNYDRTTWYAIIDSSICQFWQINLSEKADQFADNGEPIPINKTINKPVINDGKPIIKKSDKKDKQDNQEASKYKNLIDIFNNFIIDNFGKEKLNIAIYGDKKEIGQLFLLYEYIFNNNIDFLSFLKISKTDKWLKDNGLLPSLLFNQKAKITMRMTNVKNDTIEAEEEKKIDIPDELSFLNESEKYDVINNTNYLLSHICGNFSTNSKIKNDIMLKLYKINKDHDITYATMNKTLSMINKSGYMTEQDLFNAISFESKFIARCHANSIDTVDIDKILKKSLEKFDSNRV